MEKDKIVVTGIGIISALGTGLKENLTSLQNSECGITYLDSDNYISKFPFGKIHITNDTLINKCIGYTEKSTTRNDALSKIAFQMAIKDGKLTDSEVQSKRTAFISASTVGGMDKHVDMYEDVKVNTTNSQYSASYSPSSHLQKIVKHYKMKGPTSVINTACSSSANAIMLGSKLLQQNKVDIAIVGGVDCLSDFTIRGFDALGILTTELCTPFDTNRQGLNLGEASAYLVLRRDTKENVEHKYGIISGWANTNDSFHNSALKEDGSGILNCITKAISNANLEVKDITYINAHGTGTENNDLAELTAISKLFPENIKFSSTKSFTGHTLAAAGAIESVFSLLGLINQEVYPNLNIKSPFILNNTYQALRKKETLSFNHTLTNSFGFNGNCTSLIISKYEN
jgi:3-oxoacyl-(acyl-carrier-protein) synthase